MSDTEQTMEFQAEVSRLLDILVHSLYSEKQIFLRELISNASDACDKRRYAALTDSALSPGGDYRVTLRADKEVKTLTISDNGIGMSREEMVENLGTIARSGTMAFMEQLSEARKAQAAGDGGAAPTLIGQFGVGFYSAFLVSDKVSVYSRKAGAEETWRWESDGRNGFTVAPATGNGSGAPLPEGGTSVVLHLRDDESDYLEEFRLRHVVRTYSDHIGIPVVLFTPGEGDDAAGTETTLNEASALWTRPRNEITEDQYREFFHHIGHVGGDPLLTLHWKAEGMMEYTGLIFVPDSRPFDLFHPDRRSHVRLYVRRVFVTDDCRDLIPAYLRFLRGLVDSEDLALNISRETLQDNPMIARMRKAITKRVLDELKKKAKDDPQAYASFWRNFGPVLKEGIYEDFEQREALIGLTRFRSTKTNDDELVSLEDYVARMRPGQDKIFYISGDDEAALRGSPQLEGFRARDVEVLLLTDPVDEFWINSVPELPGEALAGKTLQSVTRGSTDLDAIENSEDGAESEDKDKEDSQSDGEIDGLVALFKLCLKDSVKDVRVSSRLTDSAVCLVADEGDMDMHIERMLRQHKQLDAAAPRILEVNPKHALIQGLAARVKQKGAESGVEDVAEILLDQARIIEGETLPDPAGFARRLASVLERGYGA